MKENFDGNIGSYFFIGFDSLLINLGKQLYNFNLNASIESKLINTKEKPDDSHPGTFCEFATQLKDIVKVVGPKVLDMEYLRASVNAFYITYAH